MNKWVVSFRLRGRRAPLLKESPSISVDMSSGTEHMLHKLSFWPDQ
uniref:Uncharacterized protein n=1 Tax=Arundo donax TaxID=35708 RepID=A0A0A9F9X7_ARUDO